MFGSKRLVQVWYLKPKMPYLGILVNNFEKPLSYLKSAPSNLPYGKMWCKNENP